METTGTCEQKMILDGRYLQQEYTGEMMGSTVYRHQHHWVRQPYQEVCVTWIDSMSTGIYYFEGTASADGKTITQESSYDDPVRGPMVWPVNQDRGRQYP